MIGEVENMPFIETLWIDAGSFPLMRIVITRSAGNALTRKDLQKGLQRHVNGDWGDISPEDRQNNAYEAVGLISAYDSSDGKRFWIYTSYDESVTTVLLPEDC